ncbi:TetR/AcrR family transcriptional regulator [Georgenia deserti]|uniref:TetR/AcrR family transcriptional regulator n=1 Tax=Georgenia deserti TaxID=2093781 RepID=A0ABW4L720_9MICO
MRESHRLPILDAAQRVLETRGLTAITFEAVANEAGLTKGGLVYHFHSKDDLLLALHEHVAAQWERALLQELAKPYEEASDDERLGAYVRTSARSSTRSELLLMLDAATHPAFRAPWARLLARWTPPVTRDADDGVLDRMVTRLSADGLWFLEAFTDEQVDARLRERLAEHLCAPLVRV